MPITGVLGGYSLNEANLPESHYVPSPVMSHQGPLNTAKLTSPQLQKRLYRSTTLIGIALSAGVFSVLGPQNSVQAFTAESAIVLEPFATVNPSFLTSTSTESTVRAVSALTNGDSPVAKSVSVPLGEPLPSITPYDGLQVSTQFVTVQELGPLELSPAEIPVSVVGSWSRVKSASTDSAPLTGSAASSIIQPPVTSQAAQPPTSDLAASPSVLPLSAPHSTRANLPVQSETSLSELLVKSSRTMDASNLDARPSNTTPVQLIDTSEETDQLVPTLPIAVDKKLANSVIANIARKVSSEDFDNQVYQVKPGDTLEVIAKNYQVPTQVLAGKNQLPDPNIILAGQALKIPVTKTQSIYQEIASLPSSNPNIASDIPSASTLVAQSVPATRSNSQTSTPLVNPFRPQVPKRNNVLQAAVEVISAQGPANTPIKTPGSYVAVVKQTVLPQLSRLELPPLAGVDTYLPTISNGGDGHYIWPAKGVLSSGYGWRWGRMHRGVDIAAPVGTPVAAAASGIVVASEWNQGGYGNLVEIRHSDGSLTLYAHNSRLLARPGQEVSQGQQIAEMGSTGRSTGPHLHFEVHPFGKGAVNPMYYLRRG